MRKYLLIMLSVFFVAGCDKDTPADNVSSYLIVKGHVYDSATHNPLQGIRVVMSSYNKSDKQKQNPQLSDTAYTDGNGSYSVSVNHIASTDFFDIKVDDVDGAANGGEFKSTQLGSIQWNGIENPLYGNDFYLDAK